MRVNNIRLHLLHSLKRAEYDLDTYFIDFYNVSFTKKTLNSNYSSVLEFLKNAPYLLVQRRKDRFITWGYEISPAFYL